MRFTITLFMSLILGIVSAQAPQGVGYQGVATDSEGIELVNQAISIRASILSGSVNGSVQWQETHDTSTDEFGLFALTIGEGVNTGSGLLSSFADIPWGESTYFLQIEMDATGGMDYSLMGVNQMMSVPYALYAESTNLDYDSIANYLSGDSTFVTNISNGLGGGGCDFDYPEGLDGDLIDVSIGWNSSSTYTVPSGKRLYISKISQYGLAIDGVILSTQVGSGWTFSRPLLSTIIANENQVISKREPNSYVRLIGILVNAGNTLQAITESSPTYTVPSSSTLVITYIARGTGSFSLTNPSGTGTGVMELSEDFIVAFPIAGGSVIETQNGSFNGYLVDEDYFADCGGSGSGGGGTVSSLDSLTIVNMINDALSNSVSIGVGDYYGGGVVGHIFQPGDEGYIPGETHGYVLYQDDTSIDWGCIGVTSNVTNYSVGQGPINTQTLANLCPESTFAAKWCDDLEIGAYDDWFLPNYAEATMIAPSVYLNYLNFINNNAWKMWVSEEYSFPNSYGYNCPSCSSANNAWALNYLNYNYSIEQEGKNTDGTRVVAFREF